MEALHVLYRIPLNLYGTPSTYFTMRQMDITEFISEHLLQHIHHAILRLDSASKNFVLPLLDIWCENNCLESLDVYRPRETPMPRHQWYIVKSRVCLSSALDSHIWQFWYFISSKDFQRLSRLCFIRSMIHSKQMLLLSRACDSFWGQKSIFLYLLQIWLASHNQWKRTLMKRGNKLSFPKMKWSWAFGRYHGRTSLRPTAHSRKRRELTQDSGLLNLSKVGWRGPIPSYRFITCQFQLLQLVTAGSWRHYE